MPSYPPPDDGLTARLRPAAPRPFRLRFCALLLLTMTLACGDTEHAFENRLLVKSASGGITVRTFIETFEGSLTAPSDLFQDPHALQQTLYRTLDLLTEEWAILERARELGEHVSDTALAETVAVFKADFPDHTFESTLMESGVSFQVWKDALRRRMLMEKVVQRELGMRVTAAGTSPPADMPPTPPAAAIMPPVPGRLPDTDPGGRARYGEWIQHLKKKYTIEIDWKLWEKLSRKIMDGSVSGKQHAHVAAPPEVHQQ